MQQTHHPSEATEAAGPELVNQPTPGSRPLDTILQQPKDRLEKFVGLTLTGLRTATLGGPDRHRGQQPGRGHQARAGPRSPVVHAKPRSSATRLIAPSDRSILAVPCLAPS